MNPGLRRLELARRNGEEGGGPRTIYVGTIPRVSGHLAAGESDPVAVKEGFRRTVVFICAGRDHAPVGTGFFVEIEHVTYIVTARHVLDQSTGELYVRLNRAGGLSSEDIPAPRKTWKKHQHNDIAILRFEISDNHQGWVLTDDTFLTNDFIQSHNIGPGDEVFFIGLFIGHAGKKRSLPAMRYGRLSLMPDIEERILLEWRGPTGPIKMNVSAYLIDGRAWQGFSGSPVFVTSLLGWRTIPTGQRAYFRLLGLVQAEFEKGPLNSGLVVTIPTQAILELLNSEAIVKERKEIIKERDKDLPKAIPKSVRQEARGSASTWGSPGGTRP